MQYVIGIVVFSVVPRRPMARTFSTNTVTDARVMHPSMSSYVPYTTPADMTINTSTMTTSSGNSRYGLGVISRLDSATTFVSGLNSLGDDLSSFVPPPISSRSDNPAVSARHADVGYSGGVVTKSKMSLLSSPASANGTLPMSQKPASSNLKHTEFNMNSYDFKSLSGSSRPVSSYTHYSGPASTQHTSITKMRPISHVPKAGYQGASMDNKPTESVDIAPVSTASSYGILSSFYNYWKPGPATQTTQSGLTSIVSDQMFGNRDLGATRGAYGRWQSPW